MKLSTAQIASALAKPDPRWRAILVYGPDIGLVLERARAIAKNAVPNLDDPFSVTVLSAHDIVAEPSRLWQEGSAFSFSGGRRLLKITHAVEALAGPLSAYLAELPDGDSLTLIEAGDLDKRSKLRALCEGDTPNAVAIPCYLEDASQRARTIGAALESFGLKASREVLAQLTQLLPSDRLAMRGELDKLALYVRGQSSVTHEDIRAILTDGAESELDDLVQAAALGDVRQTCALLDRWRAQQPVAVTLLRAAQRHFLRLHLARAYADSGLSIKESIDKLQPKVFWKQVEPMAKQLSRWKTSWIESLLAALYEAEVNVKRTGTPDIALCANLFLQAARRASR